MEICINPSALREGSLYVIKSTASQFCNEPTLAVCKSITTSSVTFEYSYPSGSAPIAKTSRFKIPFTKNVEVLPVDADSLSFELGLDRGYTQPSFSNRMRQLEDRSLTILHVLSESILQRTGVENPEVPRMVVNTSDGIRTNIYMHDVVVNGFNVVDEETYHKEGKRIRTEQLKEVMAKAEGVRLGKSLELGEDEIDKVLSEFRKVADESDSNSSCTSLYSFLLEDLLGMNILKGACHRGIKDGKEDQVYLVSSIAQKLSSAEGFLWTTPHKKWMDYLANRSPLAPVFVSKDSDMMIKHGACLMNVTAPGNVLSMACTATRHAYEYPMRCMAFSMLSERMNEHMAFFLALGGVGGFKVVDGEPKVTSLTLSGQSSEHTAFNWEYQSNNAIINFLAGNVANQNKPMNESRDYTSPHRTWATFETGDTSVIPRNSNFFIDSNVRSLKFTNGKKSSNPFELPKSSADLLVDEVVKMAENFVDWGEIENA